MKKPIRPLPGRFYTTGAYSCHAGMKEEATDPRRTRIPGTAGEPLCTMKKKTARGKAEYPIRFPKENHENPKGSG